MTEAWIRIGLVGVLLLLNAWYDCRKREILIWSLLVFGLVGIIYNGSILHISVRSMLGGAALGGSIILISWICQGAVGAGDGLLLCVTGIYLGFWENLELLLAALLLCAAVTAILWMSGRAHKKTSIPFVPFLFISYIGGVFW